jgi:hypothetical protein
MIDAVEGFSERIQSRGIAHERAKPASLRQQRDAVEKDGKTMDRFEEFNETIFRLCPMRRSSLFPQNRQRLDACLKLTSMWTIKTQCVYHGQTPDVLRTRREGATAYGQRRRLKSYYKSKRSHDADRCVLC